MDYIVCDTFLHPLQETLHFPGIPAVAVMPQHVIKIIGCVEKYVHVIKMRS